MCVWGECPALMSGDQRDSGNLKTSVFLHPDPSEDKELLMFHYTFFCQGFIKIVFFICLNPHHIIIQNL